MNRGRAKLSESTQSSSVNEPTNGMLGTAPCEFREQISSVMSDQKKI